MKIQNFNTFKLLKWAVFSWFDQHLNIIYKIDIYMYKLVFEKIK